MSLSTKLKNLRKQNNMTLKELSDKSGLSISFISDIENCRRNPSIEKLQNLADALGVSVNEFFSETTDDAAAENNIDRENIPQGYLRIAKEAQENGLTPEDVKFAIDWFINAKKRSLDAKKKRGE